MSRRAWLLIFLLVAVGLLGPTACRRAVPPETFKQKLVILGFDGMDPKLVRRWIDEGKLPNLARLVKQGGLYELDTTHSPESPTSWASFATGVNPGKHNIYDFLVRDTQTYLPDLGMVKRVPPRFFLNYFPISKPQVLSIRGGTSFWVTAGRAGVRSSVLTVPVTYPPEEVPNGEMLVGTAPARHPRDDGHLLLLRDRSQPVRRGQHRVRRHSETPRLRERRRAHGAGWSAQPDRATATAGGPREPGDDRCRSGCHRRTEARQDVRVPLVIGWQRGQDSATIELAGTSVLLKVGGWSTWIDLDFRVNFLIRLHGMAQLHLIRADDDLQLYVSPVNWKPDAPPLPMSSPESFSADLFARLGYFRTLGWAEATWPLEEGRLDEKAFMDDLYRAFDDRAQVILNRLDSRNWDLFVGVIESTDRVQHMMWRLIDPEHPMYDAGARAASTATRSSASIGARTSSWERCWTDSSRGSPCSSCRITASTRGARR